MIASTGDFTTGGCACLATWEYDGQTVHGCTATKDKPKPWCYVADPGGCPSAEESTTEKGRKWQECAKPEESDMMTISGCPCRAEWVYGGRKVSGCVNTFDNPEPWCYVAHPDSCEAAFRSATDPSMKWAECTEVPSSGENTNGGCPCRSHWFYEGKQVHGCTATRDNPLPWCYVTDPFNCPSGIEASSDPAIRWGFCESAASPTAKTKSGCVCIENWIYEGKNRTGCVATDDFPTPWCYVAEPEKCPGAKDSLYYPTLMYEDCPSPPAKHQEGSDGDEETQTITGCQCKNSWTYEGFEEQGCAYTSDQHGPWCYVSNPGSCTNGHKSSTQPDLVWDGCPDPNLASSSGCHCEASWVYEGKPQAGCAETEDMPGKPWCYVAEGKTCPAGKPSTVTPGLVWDLCELGPRSKHGCHCLKHWDYEGAILEGCARTEDNPTPWCFVLDGGKACTGATKSTNPGGSDYWDECAE